MALLSIQAHAEKRYKKAVDKQINTKKRAIAEAKKNGILEQINAKKRAIAEAKKNGMIK
jgi:hypothetical protein